MAVSVILVAILGGIMAARALNSERPLTPVEQVVVWWWAGIILLSFGGEIRPGTTVDAVVGVLFSGLGAFIALNISSVADHLSTRRVGLIFRKTQSVAKWRWYGAVLVGVGALWAGGVFTTP